MRLLLLPLLLLLAACAPGNRIGPRPAADLRAAVESYLQQYQPGPTPRVFETTRLTDRNGKVIAERWQEGRRTWVPLAAISQHLIDATISTEDNTFYANPGVDPARIAGAALQNAQQGQVVSGGSTITMQLARNLFLGPEDRYDQNMDRKLLEAGLAQELNTLFSKDEVLEAYLNLLNYGHLAYGPEAAAQVYFGKPAADLTQAEATLLAGIPQRPADLDPLLNFEAAKARQRLVLDLMVRHSRLSQTEADAVFAQPLTFNPAPDQTPNPAPHFAQYVFDQLAAQLGPDALRGGLRITTTLDLEMQTLAQTIASQKVAEAQPKFDLNNAALVALHPQTGDILALVGSADFENEAIAGQVNVALSPRQPGSAIKPVLYAAALSDNLISPATILWDIPAAWPLTNGQTYRPVNYDGNFHGPVTVRTALANSYNIPAVKLLDAVGPPRMLAAAHDMGIASLSNDPQQYGLSLALGSGEVSLLELTSAYATLANGGLAIAPRPILAATDASGRPLDLGQPPASAQAVSPAAAFQITDILSDPAARAPAFGANNPLRLSRPAAAKTGTTTDFRDNWTLGYTRYLVTGVWAGNSDGHPMRNTSGLTGAAPIWHDFMAAVLTQPAFLSALQAPADPAAWAFTPPSEALQRPGCPVVGGCREGGEYFSALWLASAAERGAFADRVEAAPSAPVYLDRGQGPVWTAYCQTEAAVARPLLKLPTFLGLPAAAAQPPTESLRRERVQAIAWVLAHPAPVNLGPCETLPDLLNQAIALNPDLTGAQALVDWAAAMNPDAAPVAGAPAGPLAAATEPPAPPAGLAPAGPGRFALAQPIAHHADCPGNYIIGLVTNRDGAPLAGIHITLVDQWGNRADAISKSGANDFGRYDFPINFFPNGYTLTIVDEAGNPLSPPVVVNHLQAEGGEAPCHTVNWVGG
ncbi:MAG: transglycosylase domain-containing protein [Caldilineales bacterium]|nr:transglycosylase domain-containing protein [Caldilineales bacterium]